MYPLPPRTVFLQVCRRSRAPSKQRSHLQTSVTQNNGFRLLGNKKINTRIITALVQSPKTISECLRMCPRVCKVDDSGSQHFAFPVCVTLGSSPSSLSGFSPAARKQFSIEIRLDYLLSTRFLPKTNCVLTRLRGEGGTLTV